MDPGNPGGVRDVVTRNTASQETVKGFFAMPEGIAMLQNIAGTRDDRKTPRSMLHKIIGSQNLPPGAAGMVNKALKYSL